VGTDLIKHTNKARNIGVVLDNTLTMSCHIKNIVKGAFYHLRNIAEIRKYINTATAEALVHSFVSSKFDFCNSLLYGLPKYEINKLQSVLNAAARVIACLLSLIMRTIRKVMGVGVGEKTKKNSCKEKCPKKNSCKGKCPKKNSYTRWASF